MNTVRKHISEAVWSGSRMICVLDPKPEDMILSEIATGLARETRYGGAATAIPWSVGQHSLLVVEYAEQDGVAAPDVLLTLLMHDAPEYILRDILAPVKQYLPEYKDLETVWWGAIATRFGLPFKMSGLIKHYDMIACASEKATLISADAGEWPGLPKPRQIPSKLLVMGAPAVARKFQKCAAKLLSKF